MNYGAILTLIIFLKLLYHCYESSVRTTFKTEENPEVFPFYAGMKKK